MAMENRNKEKANVIKKGKSISGEHKGVLSIFKCLIDFLSFIVDAFLLSLV